MGYLLIEQAVLLVGGLLMEQAPKAILLSDEQLGTYYEPALQNFKDFLLADHDVDFEPPADFRQKVMDHVRSYLDLKRMRIELCV